MKTGITGLQFSGKTTLFCALTGQDYEALSHKRDVHYGTVKVPDKRLDTLYEMIQPKKLTHATMECFDVAGGAAGADKTIEPKSLQALKNADSLICVVDAYNDGADPYKDFISLVEEFAFNDLLVVTNRMERLHREMKSGKKDDLVRENDILNQCKDTLEDGGSLRDIDFDSTTLKVLRGFQFLSLKPLLIVINISEEILNTPKAAELEALFADVKESVCTSICTEIEKEVAALEEADRTDFLESLGIEEAAAGRVIRLSYQTLGLISFFTAGGPDEVRAWTIRAGSNAQVSAGAIHSDLERGFIRAETVAYEDYIAAGTFKDAREKGTLRIEGRDYIVKDGDILTIRFSV